MQGRLPVPPIAHLFDMGFHRDGELATSIPASPWFQDVFGVIPAGVLAVVADAALGWAFGVTQEAGSFYTTVEMNLDVLRPVLPGPGTINARGRLVHRGSSLALTSCDVAVDGGFVAHATSLLAVRPSADRAGMAAGDDEQRTPPAGWTSPARRPLPNQPLSAFDLSQLSGLEIVRGCIEGRLPPPPLSILTGAHRVDVADGSCSAVLAASEWFRPPTPFLQGGILAMLADLAVTGAVQSVLPPAQVAATVDLKVNFLRPVSADGRDVRADARLVNRGRSMAIAEVEVRDADARLAAVALGTISLAPSSILQRP